MSSVEDELGLARPLVRVLNQAALAEFMAGELAEVSPNATLGGPRRDALIAALEASAAAAGAGGSVQRRGSAACRQQSLRA